MISTVDDDNEDMIMVPDPAADPCQNCHIETPESRVPKHVKHACLPNHVFSLPSP